jgi:hypothetical protein
VWVRFLSILKSIYQFPRSTNRQPNVRPRSSYSFLAKPLTKIHPSRSSQPHSLTQTRSRTHISLLAQILGFSIQSLLVLSQNESLGLSRLSPPKPPVSSSHLSLSLSLSLSARLPVSTVAFWPASDLGFLRVLLKVPTFRFFFQNASFLFDLFV